MSRDASTITMFFVTVAKHDPVMLAKLAAQIDAEERASEHCT